MSRFFLLIFFSVCFFSVCATAETAKSVATVAFLDDEHVTIKTSFGGIDVTLFPKKNPRAVDYFLKNVKSGSYNGTIFHRIVDGFVLQGGLYDKQFQKTNIKSDKIEHTKEQNLKNQIFTVALIRDLEHPERLTNQFFINLTNNTKLDDPSVQDDLEIIGEVTSGTDVLQKLAHVKIGQREGLYNVPFYPDEALISSIQVSK